MSAEPQPESFAGYEARDIEQSLGSQDRIDARFEARTQGLNDWQKAALREQWGTTVDPPG